MKKLKLPLESLHVESFETTGRGRAAAQGTVFGQSGSQDPQYDDSHEACGYNTEGPTCGPEHTCGYYNDGCHETYESCYPCDVTVACDTAFAGTCHG